MELSTTRQDNSTLKYVIIASFKNHTYIQFSYLPTYLQQKRVADNLDTICELSGKHGSHNISQPYMPHSLVIHDHCS
jgi:hypothetical protein